MSQSNAVTVAEASAVSAGLRPRAAPVTVTLFVVLAEMLSATVNTTLLLAS